MHDELHTSPSTHSHRLARTPPLSSSTTHLLYQLAHHHLPPSPPGCPFTWLAARAGPLPSDQPPAPRYRCGSDVDGGYASQMVHYLLQMGDELGHLIRVLPSEVNIIVYSNRERGLEWHLCTLSCMIAWDTHVPHTVPHNDTLCTLPSASVLGCLMMCSNCRAASNSIGC